METNAPITVTQNTCVPMKYFDTFLQAGGIISMLESNIKVHWEQRPDAKVAVCGIVCNFTGKMAQYVVVPCMSASQIFHNLNNAILHRLSCITTHDASYMIPQQYHELQILLWRINGAFGSFPCALVARTEKHEDVTLGVPTPAHYISVDANAHKIRATPDARIYYDGTTYRDAFVCATQEQGEPDETYAKKMQNTREEWEFANRLLLSKMKVAKKKMVSNDILQSPLY